MQDASFAQDNTKVMGDLDFDQDNSQMQSQFEDLDEEQVDLCMQSQLGDIGKEKDEADNPVLLGVDEDILPPRKSSRKKMLTNFLS